MSDMLEEGEIHATDLRVRFWAAHQRRRDRKEGEGVLGVFGSCRTFVGVPALSDILTGINEALEGLLPKLGTGLVVFNFSSKGVVLIACLETKW